MFRVNHGSVSSVRNHSPPPQISSSICPLMGWAKFIRFNFLLYFLYRVNKTLRSVFIVYFWGLVETSSLISNCFCRVYLKRLWLIGNTFFNPEFYFIYVFCISFIITVLYCSVVHFLVYSIPAFTIILYCSFGHLEVYNIPPVLLYCNLV